MTWQVDLKAGAQTGLRVDGDPATMVLDNAIDDGQAKSGSLGKLCAVPTQSCHLAADTDNVGLAGAQVAFQVSVVLLVIRRRHQHFTL